MPTQAPPFLFIVGYSEVGRDLLRGAFDAHAELAVPPSYPFAARLARRRASFEAPDGLELFAKVLAKDRRLEAWGFDQSRVASIVGPGPIDFPTAVRALYAAYAESKGKARYADASDWLVRSIPLLSALYPESRFLHVVEDPRAVTERELGSGESLGRVADLWRESVAEAIDAGSGLPAERYQMVRAEDVAADPMGAAKSASEALDLELDPAGFAPVAITVQDPPILLHDQIRSVEMIVGGILRHAGYEPKTRVKGLGYTERKRLVGEFASGRRSGAGVSAKERFMDLLDRSPALAKVARKIRKAVRR